MLGVKYIAPIMDNSGYGSAARSYILSLYKKGIPICVEPHCFESNQYAVGTKEEREIFEELMNKKIPYDVVVCQLTPDMAITHHDPTRSNISYFPWETSLVHPKWVACLNLMKMVWAPCKWNVDSYKNSGIERPVYKIPHGININKFNKDIKNCREDFGVSKDTYVFYNIFQWNYRKNPESLIRAYFNAFSSSDDVLLVLKTYIRTGAPQEQAIIADKIATIKRDMGLKSYPRIVLITSLTTDDQIESFHTSFDCCISLHFAEGFGLVPFEAGLAGNPVIATGATGNMEFMKENNSYPVNFQWSYVKEMSSFNQWYLGSGTWASPSEIHASELMRRVFENREEAKNKGLKLKEHIVENFSWEKVSEIMCEYLRGI